MTAIASTAANSPAQPLDAARDLLAGVLDAATAPATRRAYRTAWAAWLDWAAQHGAAAIPADPAAVALYLAARAATGSGMATLRMAVAAIGAAHKVAGQPSPAQHPTVQQAMAGFARSASTPPRQAKGLTADAVATIRGALNGQTARLSGAVTMALVSVMADAGLRRSEAAALAWADVARADDGSGRITVRRSKTDQEADGAVVAITAAAMADLDRVATLRGDRDPAASVFGLSDRSIARRIAKAATAAGLGDGFTGHSGRVGMAQRMTRNQAPAAAVMRQGRWNSPRMIARYTRNEAAGEALRYL